MARKKPRRYGSGIVVELKGGFVIRWWETIIGADGQERRKMGYENLGDVTRKEAESRLAEKLVSNRRAGPRQEQVIPTFSEHAARYKRDILPMPESEQEKDSAIPKQIHKFSTRSVRRTILDRHLIPRFGSMLVSSITTAHIQAFIAELLHAGYTKAGRHEYYGAHALHDILKVMRVVMGFSMKWHRQPVDLITGQPVNPATDVELPALEDKREKWALSPEQSGKLIGTLRGKAKVMVALAVTCGMRRGELLAFRLRHLSVSDVDGRRLGHIHVTEASYLGHVGTPKTKKGIRKIEVPDWVLGLIEDLISRSKKRNPEDLVFGTRTNRIENSNNILRRQVYPACAALELRHVDWLTCRRTFQTLAHNELIPARTIADIMGHAKVETQFIYNQPVEEMKRVAADRLGNILCELVRDFEEKTALVS